MARSKDKGQQAAGGAIPPEAYSLETDHLHPGIEQAAFASGGYPYPKRMKRKLYAAELEKLQIELLKMHAWAQEEGERVVVVFEGRDAAGKGGTIKRFTQHLNPRLVNVVALPKPSEVERGQWYFQRYVPYMPTKGSLGLEMMQNTCTVQVNLDFDSENTMVEMFRIGLALQPFATALWANSPFRGGEPNGYLSYRSHIWSDTDPDRTGMLPFVFDDDFGFERYVDYALDVPMYFVYRDGVYHDASGKSFRDFLAGKLDGFEGEHPQPRDWEDHLTTIFPEVRLKRYLEMRGADGGPWRRLCALPAFWVGLLYDDRARADALDLIADWTAEERQQLRDRVPLTALATPFRGETVRELACKVLTISRAGLCRRNRTDWVGLDETHFLKPLFQIADSGMTPAEEMLSAYRNRWSGDIRPVFQEYAY